MREYKSVEKLGRGGFGIVEKVVDNDGVLFARKKFNPAPYIPVSAHARLRKRFRREVIIQAELGGSEIMPVLEYDFDCPQPWFVMPMADRTYEEQVSIDKAAGSVDVDAIADILNGLEQLHKLGYVHRDLNPKNILLHDGHWKLSDLGAVLPPSGQTVTLTEGTTIYTEQYCSPEQRNDFHNAQASADVYSFGCILHDIFGDNVRIPYQKHTASGGIGMIIEKCTELNPLRRPTVGVLRGLLLETLVEMGGRCRIDDERSEEWLSKISDIDNWDAEEYDKFARFFAQLNLHERCKGHENDWVYPLSTPFLTRVPSVALVKIADRRDGIADAIIERYCEWARVTRFLFHYADMICTRLTSVFDVGSVEQKALTFVALIQLAESHNRWHVMRETLERANPTTLVARRLAIEIRTEQVEHQFRRCVEEVEWKIQNLAPELARFCKRD